MLLRAFKALADNKVNILMISTSPIRISVVVDGDQVETAVAVAFHTNSGSIQIVFSKKRSFPPKRSLPR